MRRQRTRRSRRACRRGASAVEFAFIAPVFLTIVLGSVEAGRLFEAQNQLAMAAREGARLAAMDRSEILNGQSTNQKIEQDVRGYLTSNGLPGSEVDIFIVDADDGVTPMDLDHPDNLLELFELRIETTYSETGWSVGYWPTDPALTASVVFRNSRSSN